MSGKHGEQPSKQHTSLPRLQTSYPSNTSASTDSYGPALTRSRPASPVLTAGPSSAISLKDLAASFEGRRDGSNEQEARQMSYIKEHLDLPSTSQPLPSPSLTMASQPSASRVASNSHPDAALSPSKSVHGEHDSYTCSSEGRRTASTSSRPSSRNTMLPHSPGVNASQSRSSVGTTAAPGGGVSRSSTPLLYNYNNIHHQLGHIPDNSHSSSSFLLAGDSYTQLPISASPSSSTTNCHTNQNPIYHHRRPSSKSDNEKYNPFSPQSISCRMKRFISDVKLALAIGVQGEWRDTTTGKWKVPSHLKAYIPLLVWVAVSIAFGLVIGIWHEQVFAGLDSLSTYLKSQGFLGDFILYLCIFITTFPPLPLYSTLIILSGYSFGLIEGFLISYTAALSGAIIVYLCSKMWLKDGMENLLNKSQGLKKVVRAIERRPRLLWLIRLSPYPYNVMNVLLASSSTLTFPCYFWCTALALPKLLIHCSVGTTIRSFADSAQNRKEEDLIGDVGDDEGLAREMSGQRMKAIAGTVGILLCVGVFIYLLIVARRAVDELDDEDSLPIDGRSRSSSNLEGHSGHEGIPEGRTSMAEYRPLSAGLTHVSVVRPSFDNTSASRKSLNMDGMVQRQVFERQNTTTFNTIARRSHSIDLPPSYDGKWRMTRESNEGNKLLGGSDDGDVDEVESANSSIVNRLESIAYDRSQKYAE